MRPCARMQQPLGPRSHAPQVLLREEEEEPQRRTKIVPQLMEREKHWRLRAAQAQGQGKQ